jgi:hypothetical protein
MRRGGALAAIAVFCWACGGASGQPARTGRTDGAGDAADRSQLAQLQADLSTEEGRAAELALEIEALEDEVADLRSRMARGMLRAHLEQVVAQEMREAAAMEAAAEDSLSPEARERLAGARMVVGRELLATVRMRVFLAQQMAARGRLVPESLSRLVHLADRAEAALAARDMDGVYRFAELAVEEYHQRMDDAMLLTDGADNAGRLDALSTRLREAGFPVGREEVGCSLAVEVDAGGIGSAGMELLRALAAQLSGDASLLLVAVVSASREADRPVAARVSGASGRVLRDALVTAGAGEAQVVSFDMENERPLDALSGSGRRAAVLIVPLP